MDATRRWLDELDRRREDQTWLAAHESELHAAIKRAVFLPPLLHLGVKAIFLIHPYLLNASDLNPGWTCFITP
jgi:hypothetical protein